MHLSSKFIQCVVLDIHIRTMKIIVTLSPTSKGQEWFPVAIYSWAVVYIPCDETFHTIP